MRNLTIALAAAVAAVVLLHAKPADACGGLIEADTGTVAQTGQLGIISVNGDKTDVVLALDVADAQNAFGVLVPVPGEPVIDGEPVPNDAIASLELQTRPFIAVSGDGGGGADFFSCGGAALDGGAPNKRSVVVGDEVAIGPVTAQWVSGGDGADVAAYLAQEGFALPDGGEAIVQSYVDRGLSFLAFKRNETSTGPARVGVHFTLDGDHRAYALQMTKLGSLSAMHFTIFVATADADGVGADTPYSSLTVDKLDRALVESDYTVAVANAVAAVGGKAFVVETKTLAGDLGIAELDGIIPAGHTITRLTSVMNTADLDADVSFTSKAPAEVVGAGVTSSSSGPTLPPAAKLADLALLLALASMLVFVPRVVRRPVRVAVRA